MPCGRLAAERACAAGQAIHARELALQDAAELPPAERGGREEALKLYSRAAAGTPELRCVQEQLAELQQRALVPLLRGHNCLVHGGAGSQINNNLIVNGGIGMFQTNAAAKAAFYEFSLQDDHIPR